MSLGAVLPNSRVRVRTQRLDTACSPEWNRDARQQEAKHGQTLRRAGLSDVYLNSCPIGGFAATYMVRLVAGSFHLICWIQLQLLLRDLLVMVVR